MSKRFTKGLNLNASYTRATFLDNCFEGGSSVGSDGNPLTYLNYYDRRADWGPSRNDIRHRVTFSSVYELPFGPGKRWATHGVTGTVVGGWTFGTVATAQTGAPFTVTTNTDTSNSFSSGGSQRADVVRDPVLPSDQRTVNRWFDTTAFVQPALYTFGNVGRDSMRAPGIVNVDLSILRNFRLGERATLQFRGESLNAINHTNLSSPVSVLGNGSFGQITSARAARVMQIGMKIRF
jgi:hypothetical protein